MQLSFSASPTVSHSTQTNNGRISQSPTTNTSSTNTSPTGRKAKQVANDLLLASQSSHTTTQSTSSKAPELQSFKLKEKVHYTYEYRSSLSGEKGKFDIPFPIVRIQNFCTITGSASAQFDSDLDDQQVADAIEQNFTVYKRKAFKKEKIAQTIDEVFNHARKPPLTVKVENVLSEDGNHHFKFAIKLVFASHTASKTSQVFWGLQIKDEVIAKDILVEKETKTRDLKIDAKKDSHGNTYFEEWEQNVCWYKEYLETVEKPDSDQETGVGNGLSTTRGNSSDTDDEGVDSFTTFLSSAETSNKRHRSSSSTSTSTTSKRRKSTAVDQDQNPTSLATAQIQAEKIKTLLPGILKSLEAGEKEVEERKVQTQELQRQLAQRDGEKTELEKKVQLLNKCQQQLESTNQTLTDEVTRLKEKVETSASLPQIKALQEQIKKAQQEYNFALSILKNDEEQFKQSNQSLETQVRDLEKTNQEWCAKLNTSEARNTELSTKLQEEAQLSARYRKERDRDRKELKELKEWLGKMPSTQDIRRT